LETFHFLSEIFLKAALFIDLTGITIVLFGFLSSLISWITIELSRFKGPVSLKSFHVVRCKLGTYILMGLEFMIASDIINTFVKQSKEDLIFLAAIVIIRTVIAYFLGKEMEHIQKEEALA